MCNPSPRGRCQGDAAKAVSSKIANFQKEADEFYAKTETEHIAEHGTAEFVKKRNSLNERIAEVNEASTFYYATPYAQGDTLGAMQNISKLQGDLTSRQKSILGNHDQENRRVGKLLSKFQSVARDYAKEHKDKSNMATARTMAGGGFNMAYTKLRTKLNESYQENLSKTLAVTDSSKHASVTRRLQKHHSANLASLDKAYHYASEDAKSAVAKDIKKNSGTFNNTVDKHKFGFYKNTDGSFTVRTRFEVQAKNFGEAVEKAEGSFKLEDVEMTLSKPNNGIYTVDTSYLYKGGESIDDAKKFHQSTWNGTPRLRSSIADIQRVNANYEEDRIA